MAEKTICGFIADIMDENAAKNNSPENDEDNESQVYSLQRVHGSNAPSRGFNSRLVGLCYR